MIQVLATVSLVIRLSRPAIPNGLAIPKIHTPRWSRGEMKRVEPGSAYYRVGRIGQRGLVGP